MFAGRLRADASRLETSASAHKQPILLFSYEAGDGILLTNLLLKDGYKYVTDHEAGDGILLTNLLLKDEYKYVTDH